MNYTVKPIVCDYAVVRIGGDGIVCICNIKRNAELIADILNGDTENSCAYSYDAYPYAKYKIATEEKDEEEDKTGAEQIIEEDKESENKRMSKLEKAKEIVKKYYNDADCGIFDSRNILGDDMITIYKDEGLKIDICYNYAYFEVFGLTNKEFRELEKYYDSLEKEEK